MLRVGVFGVGHLGKFHINNWKDIEGTKIIGFFDPNDKTAQEVQDLYGIKRFTSEDHLLENIDIADIVTPTNQHFAICVKAARLGVHIFVEKPMANNMKEAEALVKIVKEANIKLQVGHVERYNPAFLAIKEVPLDPMFIEVHRLSQFNPRGTEVSVIMDLMIHDIDIVLKLVKNSVKSVHANGVAVLTDTPDIANARIEFDNGCVANLTSSRVSLKKMRKMRIFQKDKYVGIDFLEKKSEVIKLVEQGESPSFSFEVDTPLGNKSLSFYNPPIKDTNAIKMELEAFKNSIINNTPTEINEIDGMLAMELAHQIIEKIQRTEISRFV